MKHCKTLLMLVAATIVMLTSGCSRQTVHPVPIRYNFLDHIPDYDPMLLDTELLSEPHSAIREAKPLIEKGMIHKVPVAIGYRFVVPQTPDPDPTFPGTDLRTKKTAVGLANEPGNVAVTPEIRFRINLHFGPDQDPMLSNQELQTTMRSVELKAALEESIEFENLPSAHNCFQFNLETSPDPDPMLLGIESVTIAEQSMLETALAVGYIMPRHRAIPVRYQFDLTATPDYDPMLHQPASVAGAGSARSDSTLAATSGKATTYR